MAAIAKNKARFAPAPKIVDAQVWGVWDRRDRCWAEPPAYAREAAERIATAMVKAFDAGFAREHVTSVLCRSQFRYRAAPSLQNPDSWGVRDNRLDEWAKRPLYALRWAERITNALNEAYAPGFAEAMIEQARRQRRQSS